DGTRRSFQPRHNPMLSNALSRQAPEAIPVRRSGQHTGLLLGWGGRTPENSFGFGPGPDASSDDFEPVIYDGDAPLLSCAVTGAGKGRGVFIPNLGLYPGPVKVIDIKGELYQVTSRCRRQMGQQVHALDAFHVVTRQSDGCNPMDVMTLPRSDIENDSQM